MHRIFAKVPTLLPEEALVESKLLTFENISIATAALARPRRNYRVETTSLKLLLERTLGLARNLQTLGLFALHAFRFLLLLLLLTSLSLPPTA